MIEIRLLGEFSLSYDGELIELRSSRLQSLLAYLILHNSAPQRREYVAFALWPDVDETKARRNLRQLLYRLRKTFPRMDQLLQITRQTLHWSPSVSTRVDAVAFRTASKTATSIDELQTAIGYYTGTLLPAGYDEWLLREREHLRLNYLNTLEALIVRLEQAERYEDAIPYARRLIADEPLREGTYRRLMRLYAGCGDRAGALRVYRECTRVLQTELGIEPSEATQVLYDELVRTVPAAQTPNNLPTHPTPFVGRSVELAEVAELLEEPDCRLLTIAGPGGIGKTRLALQAAREQLDSFPDGVYVVPLAAVAEADALVPAIADAIDVPIRSTTDIRRDLFRYLRDKHMLLVLDNVEQLIDAATDLLLDLLESTNYLVVLVTSRERLRLRWEWRFALEGLRLPNEQSVALLDSSAVRLFQEVARRADHRFVLTDEIAPAVARVCYLTAGMPLAIELAASLVSDHPCDELATRIADTTDVLATEMRDMPARHRSVRATFEYSWSRLTPALQAAYRRLSVFRGGFTQHAAESVAGVSQNALAALVDRSFLHEDGQGRYSQHPLLQQFAAEYLAQYADEKYETSRAHCKFYINFAATHAEDLNSMQHREALALLSRDVENVRAGWMWAVDHQQYETIRHTIEPLYNFYWYGNRLHEGLELFNQTTAHFQRNAAPEAVLLMLQVRRATLLYRVGRSEHAAQLLQACTTRLRRLNMRNELAFALSRGGYVQQILGNYAEARELAREGLALRRELGSRGGLASTLNDCGIIAMKQGNLDEARTLLQESLAIRTSAGNAYSPAVTTCNLGVIAGQMQEFEEAQRLFEESLDLYERLNDRNGVAYVLNNLAVVARKNGAYARARRLLERSLAIKRILGDRWSVAGSLNNLGSIAFEQGELHQARAYYRDVVQMSSETKAIPAVLYALAGLASILQKEGRSEPALTIATFVVDHAACNRETEALAASVREKACQCLPAEERNAAVSRAAIIAVSDAIALAQDW